jgi:hypothetical protein
MGVNEYVSGVRKWVKLGVLLGSMNRANTLRTLATSRGELCRDHID